MKQIWRTIRFAYDYCQKIDRGVLYKIWLARIYADLYPIINSYFLKLLIDIAVGAGQGRLNIDLWTLGWIFLSWFTADSLSQFLFRYQLMQVRIMQRRLTSRLEADLAYLHASVPISVVEDSRFRDEYTFVKREVGFRMFTVVSSAVDLLSAFISVTISLLIISRFGLGYTLILFGIFSLRFVGVNKAVNKSVTAMQTSAKYSRLWEIYNGFLESAKSSYESRILNIKEMVRKRIQEIMDKTVGLYAQTEKSLFPMRVVTAVLPMFGILVVGFHSLRLVLQGILSVGNWQLLFNTSITFSNKFKDLADSTTFTRESGEYINHLLDLYAWDKNTAQSGKKFDITKIHSLEFKNISFRYPNTEPLALKNISFTIKENENIAVVGINGAGKTTLVKLLCKFYEPTEGEILINSQNISQFTKESYWQQLSALFQDFERFPMSARESIGFGDVSRIQNLADITTSAKLMGMNDYFQSLPQGYDTPLIRDLEGGVDLSTGQWQKTALSRALFRPSQVIILDEPTSNIDPQSEEEIFEKLIKVVKNRIMLLISHRFSTVKKADRILVIDQGELIEQGTHKELMNLKGKYAKLFKIQAKNYQ